ncbi:MAG TPA: DUF4058 family protein [Gemmataceae bacterium]|nr:DUF4058 family protein [Gemmataceae bacterium]
MPIHDWSRVDAGIFHDFHLEWISALKHVLNEGVLPADYYALAEQVSAGFHPDVLTLNRGIPPEPAKTGNGALPESGGGGIALATAPPKVRFSAAAASDTYAQKRRRIAIRHVSGDRVAALVEIVSPGNKASQHAMRSFIDKALEFLDAGIHLLILDLFRPGPRDTQGIHGVIWSAIKDETFTLPADKPLTLASYAAGAVTRAFIEPVAVGDSLPVMPLFLEPEYYVQVPLEKAYQSAFERVPRRWREILG